MSLFLHPVTPFAILVPVAITACPLYVIPDHAVKLRLIILPLLWTLIGVFGAAFRNRLPFDIFSNMAHRADRLPHFFSDVVLWSLILFIVYGLYQLFKNVGYRRFTAVYFLINLWFALFISFVAGMSISGVWL
jgi:hypothetical protein